MKITRRLVQLAFLALTIVGVFVIQGHAERWCPFGGVEALYGYWQHGNLTCSLGVSNFYILGAVLLLTLLVRRAFCGYVCPVGTISEWLRLAGRRIGLPAWRVPYRLDRILGLLKYPVLAIILYFTWRAGELIFRGFDPCYALISRHGTDILVWAYVVSGAIVLASLLIMVPFCRWLCPLAAVFAPFSRLGLARVRRHGEACTDCGACARACPMGIQVDKVPEVTAARCTSCLDCLAICPQISRSKQPMEGGPALSWGLPKAIGGGRLRRLRWWPTTMIVAAVGLCIGGAVAATYAFPLPSFVQIRGTPPSQTETLWLSVSGVNCRHSTEQFASWLERTDEFRIRGYLRVDAWPAPSVGRVRITFDPQQTSEARIRAAITEPRFDPGTKRWEFPACTLDGAQMLP